MPYPSACGQCHWGLDGHFSIFLPLTKGKQISLLESEEIEIQFSWYVHVSKILVLIVTLEHGHVELFEESWKDLKSKTPLKYIKWFVSLPRSVHFLAIPDLYLHTSIGLGRGKSQPLRQKAVNMLLDETQSWNWIGVRFMGDIVSNVLCYIKQSIQR